MPSKLLVGAYLAAIVAANLLVVAFGPSVTVLNAFLFIGLSITTRDHLHDAWQRRGLFNRMALLIVAGSALSWLLNRDAGPIALASLLAFAGSETVDTIAYQLLHNQRAAVRINGSNIASAAVDSLLFPILAFGFPVLWWVVAGQFAAKVLGGAIWAWLLSRRKLQAVTP